jgi:hypothetical protein
METHPSKAGRLPRICWLVGLLVFFDVFASDLSYAERGRVRIVDGVVVADNGSLLRGAHGNYSNTVYKQLSWWTNLRDKYKLNTVRLDTRITWPPDSDRVSDMLDLNKIFADVDVAVNKAAEAGMYIIVDNHTSCCGNYNRTLVEAFWEKAAPRYKDRTHVIFEMQNEPVAWYPKDYTADDIQFQADMYQFIRARAPKTHIILWSFSKSTSDMKAKIDQAPAIDYSNASVGIHPYRHTTTNGLNALNALRASYPVIITEFANLPDKNTYPLTIWDFAETNGISWMYLDLRFFPDGSYGNYGDGVWDPKAWPVTWPSDPYFDGPPPAVAPAAPKALRILRSENPN